MERRLWEMTTAFRDIYRPRGGIEGLFGRLKLWTGLGRLLVRGKKAVFHAIYYDYGDAQYYAGGSVFTKSRRVKTGKTLW